MSGMIITVTPTFLLRGIDPQKIISEYRKGVYADVTLEKVAPTQKLEVVSKVATILPIQSCTIESDVYAFHDKNNGIHVVLFSNNHNYKDVGTMLVERRCDWCHRPFSAKMDELLGAPLRMEERFIPMEGDRELVHTYVFFVEGSFHSFNCALADIRGRISARRALQDSTYEQSEGLLMFLFRLIHPGKTLVAAKDYRLLDINGGSITTQEFDEVSHYVYQRTSNCFVVPIKVPYLRI